MKDVGCFGQGGLDDIPDIALFSCNDICDQMTKKDIVAIRKAVDSGTLSKSNRAVARKIRFKNRQVRLGLRKLRYTNDMGECGICGKLVDLSMSRHMWSDCTKLGDMQIDLKVYSKENPRIIKSKQKGKGENKWDDQLVWDTLLEFRTKLKVKPRGEITGLITNRCCTAGLVVDVTLNNRSIMKTFGPGASK